jgi:hypothetical protein
MGGCARDQAGSLGPGNRTQHPGQFRRIGLAGGVPGRHGIKRCRKPVQRRTAAERGQHVVLPKKCEKCQMLGRLGLPVGQGHFGRGGDQAVEGSGPRAGRYGKSGGLPGTCAFTQ